MIAGGGPADARAYTTRAIVLRARPLGEADRIYTLLTMERGKIAAVAKGVRRARSRLAGRLELLGEVRMHAHRGRTLDVMTAVDVLHAPFDALVIPTRYAAASLMAELVDAFCEPDLAVPEVYALLATATAALARANDGPALVPRFVLRLLGALGHGPELTVCVRCGGELAQAWVDVDGGGLACVACRPHGTDRHALRAEDVENIRALAAGPGGSVRPTVRAHPAVARAVDALLHHELGRRPRASAFLAELAADGPGPPSGERR